MEGQMTVEERLDRAWRDCGWPDEKHYGIWHPLRSWATTGPGEVMAFTSEAVAEAQRDALAFALRGLTSIDPSLYEVRCIEEWADEQQDA